MTLEMMDEELPRDEDSISNRNLLKRALNLDKLMEKNKESQHPYKAMLEVMTKGFIDKGENCKSGRASRISDVSERHTSSEEDVLRVMHITSSPGFNTAASQSGRYQGNSTHPNTSRQITASSKKKDMSKSDLVIDDDVQGETLLGDGRAGILGNHDDDHVRLHVTSGSSRPKSRLRGMAGPISSSTEDRQGRSTRLKSAVRPSSGRTKPPPPTTALTTKPSPIEPLPLSNAKSNQQLVCPQDTNTSQGRPQPAKKESVENVLDDERAGIRGSSLEEDSSDDSSRHSSNTDLTSDNKRPNKPSTARFRRDDTLLSYGISKSCVQSEITAKPVNFLDAVNNTRPKTSRMGDIEIGEVDDLDTDVGQLDLRPRKPLMMSALITDCKPIDIQTAVEMKTLCFGTASKGFNEEWSQQGFTFCTMPKLTYGIVQKKGGPCGVLACVQAAMLQQLLFCMQKDPPRPRKLEVPAEEQSEALALGLADILWRAGDKERAVVVLPSNRSIFNGGGRYRPDNLTETLVLNHFKSYNDLSTFLKDHIHQFEDDGQPGVVLIVYSAILTRTVKKIRDDMDEKEGKLIGVHNYCSQDLVNLLMLGEAVSNTFNDYILLDTCKLKGCSRRADIGFLSLFEHYKSCEVGTYLKTPRYPIWIVCSESHFSVLFCLRKDLISDWRVERRFDLFYYDGLANQDEEIRLTVITSNRGYRPPPPEDDLIPPLELCIRTKWPEAEIDWNGTEPLL